MFALTLKLIIYMSRKNKSNKLKYLEYSKKDTQKVRKEKIDNNSLVRAEEERKAGDLVHGAIEKVRKEFERKK
jgi:hypothetical protein